MSNSPTNDANQTTANPGELIRQARESRGIHLAAMAALLKVPVERLEALESCRYEDLPDLVFARALAMSVCRYLRIDSVAILQAMPGSDNLRQLVPRNTLQTPVMTRSNATFSSAGKHTGLLTVMVVVLVVGFAIWTLFDFVIPKWNHAETEVPGMPPETAVQSTGSTQQPSQTPAVEVSETVTPRP